jgi:hypothetical protein
MNVSIAALANLNAPIPQFMKVLMIGGIKMELS